jgi:hypothetical protein
MAVKKKKTISRMHYVLNIYVSGKQVKKQASVSSDNIIKSVNIHKNKGRKSSYYVIKVYKGGKPIRKHMSKSAEYIIKRMRN